MKIKNVLHILREIKYIKSVLSKYSNLLAMGEYVLLPNFRSLSLKNSETFELANSYFKKPNDSLRMAYIADKFNRIKYFVNKNKKTTSEYEALYTSNNYDKNREVKLFSFKKNKILTICTSSKEKDKQILQYESFKNSYNMPAVENNDYYPNAYEISMISLKDFPGDALALETICRSTATANPSLDKLKWVSSQELIDFSYNNEEINSLLNELCSKIDKNILDMELPVCIQHGDLSKENLLYGQADGKTDFWWIDWEHAGERVFFYDYFFYIINSALYYDTKAYDLYINGDSDELLKNFFAHFGLVFETEKRKDYFLLFAVIFLKERVCNFGRIDALKKYCEFIETH